MRVNFVVAEIPIEVDFGEEVQNSIVVQVRWVEQRWLEMMKMMMIKLFGDMVDIIMKRKI